MADDTQQQVSDQSNEYFDPVKEARTGPLDVSGFDDKTLFTHLNDPNKFRAAIPQYSHLSDDEISNGMQKVALRRPDLAPPPSLSVGKPNTNPASMKMEMNSGYTSPDEDNQTSQPGYLQRLGQSLGIPTNKKELESAQPSLAETIAGPAYTVGKSTYNYGKGIVDKFGEGIKEAKEAGQNIGEGQPVLPNILKGVISPATRVATQAIPLVGSAMNQAGEDIASGNQRGAAGVLTGVIGQVVAPELIKRGLASRAARTSPLPVEDATRELTKAINPPDVEWESNMRNNVQFKNVEKFAKDNNLPLNSQLDYAKAARGAANQTKEFYHTNMLDPHANNMVNVGGMGYGGKTVIPNGTTAYLGDIDARIGDINNKLREGFVKKEGGQVMSALSSEEKQALLNEASNLTDTLHKEIAKSTGYTPEQVAQVRQRMGQQYSLADQTQHAVNTRQSGMSRSNEGVSLPTSKSGVIDRAVSAVTGSTPETRANSAFRKAAKRTGNLPQTDLPQAGLRTGGVSPNASSLGRVNNGNIPLTSSNLVNIPTPQSVPISGTPSTLSSVASPTPPQASALGVRPVTNAPSMYEGSSVPKFISNALESIPTTQPTGQSLTEPPFSYPYVQGEELRDLASEPTAGSKQARARFYSSNPSALDRLPSTGFQEAENAKPTPKSASKSNPSALGKIGEAAESAKKSEVEKLKARLKELEGNKAIKNASNPTRDTEILNQVRTEHPEWSLSQQLQEAAKRVK